VPRLGELLRTQREKKGITLEQATADTRIREKFLAALEAGDYQSLPGAVYTKGFLRNYAEYLDLDQEDLVVQFQQERGLIAEPARAFEPMRPIARRSVILTPAVFIPVLVLAGIALFVGYLYYQFTSFAVAPVLEVTDPSTDVIAQQTTYVLKGHTVPTGKVTVTVFPGPLTISDIRPDSDGTFTTTVNLTAGANHVVVEVLDQSGKVSRVSRSIMLQPDAAASASPVKLIVDSPANGARFENTFVTVSGTTDGTLTVNGAAASVTNGHFEAHLSYPAGQQTITIVARNAAGASVTEMRTVTVAYTAAVVQVTMKGGDAWMQAMIDGTVVVGTGRVYKDGESATFTGHQVVVRTGNAAVTQITHNGVPEGALGTQGQVVEKTYTAQ
jgi:cytoskeletal protein RodZ